MNILHLSSEKTWRGGEQQIAYLIDELNQLGVQNFVVCRKGSSFEDHCIQNKIPYTSYPFKHSLDIKSANGINVYSKQKNIDLIHMHSAKSHAIGVLSTLLGNKKPMILSRRVDFPIRKSWFSLWKYNHPQIKRILCVSEKIEQIVRQGIKEPQKCVTVHSGVDLNRFAPDKATGFLRKTYKIDKSIKIVGNASALAPHKDYFTFIDAAEKILKERDDIYFFIIGKGQLESDLKEYASRIEKNNHIVFTGFLKNIPEVLPELDIFMITSETEGLGTTILDAFLSEVPVVATAAGGIPELVEDRKTGLLSPVKDSDSLARDVMELLESNTLYEHVIRNAKEKTMLFDKKTTAQKTLLYYNEVINKTTSI